MKDLKIMADAGHAGQIAWDRERFQFLDRQEVLHQSSRCFFGISKWTVGGQLHGVTKSSRSSVHRKCLSWRYFSSVSEACGLALCQLAIDVFDAL